MRTIAHLSDLHFGRFHHPLMQPIIRRISELKPDLVAVSGDLTQRALVGQFKDARSFLDSLPSPQIVIPGNHDIPLLNPVLRLLQPYSRFQRYITNDLSPMYIDDEIAVLGINTARALIVSGGRVDRSQTAAIPEPFCRPRDKQTKIVVTHHPFDVPEGYRKGHIVRRSRGAMDMFAECGVDLFLAGHLHVAHAQVTARYRIPGYSALVLQAGTSTSTRRRGELNSFNLIRVDYPLISIELHSWLNEHRRFEITRVKRFRRSGREWLSE